MLESASREQGKFYCGPWFSNVDLFCAQTTTVFARCSTGATQRISFAGSGTPMEGQAANVEGSQRASPGEEGDAERQMDAPPAEAGPAPRGPLEIAVSAWVDFHEGALHRL